jgi:hypothetical protein
MKKYGRRGGWAFLATIAAGLLGASATLVGSEDPFPGEQSRERARDLFRRRVYPMLQAKCLGCHGDGEELEAALDLRTREAMLQGGKGGPALVPGDPGNSLLYQSLLRTDERMMPPKDRDRLEADEVKAVMTWIEAGAPWASAQAR